MKITITVPIPAFNPNNNFAGWAAKAAQKKQDREKATEEAMCAVAELPDWRGMGFPWKTATVSVRWFHPSAAHRDRDNIISSLKPTIDGIRRAGVLVNDDDLHFASPERLTDKENPRVEILLDCEITESEGE